MLNPWPNFDEEEVSLVSNVLKSGDINYLYGEEGKLFEKEFSNFIGLNHSICFSNGTTALYAAYRAIDLESFDEIITTPRTFIGTISPAILLGAKPVFAEVDLNSGCITCDSIAPLINDRTKAICVVHLAGWPTDIDKIAKLAKENNIYLIEDCSQAHGAFIGDNSVGSFGDISVWSFCTDKIISTGGEGGMASTNSLKLFNKLWSFKDHGKSFSKFNEVKTDNKFKYLHSDFGLNLRMTEMQSALGRYQLRNLSQTSFLRNRNAMIIISYLKEINCISFPLPNSENKHGFYKLYGYLKFKFIKQNWDRERIIKEIQNRGFPCYVGSCSEIYLEECFQKKGYSPKKRLKNAKELGETSLMFLVHQTISETQIHNYALTIKNVLLSSCI